MFYHRYGAKVFTPICWFICLIACISCERESYPNATLFTRDDFPRKVLLKGEILALDSLWMVRDICVRDSILVVTEVQRSPFVRLYNVRNGHKIGAYISAGRGPDELAACSQFQIVGDWIWAIDITQGKYLKYKIKEPFEASFEKPVDRVITKGLFLFYPFVFDSNRVAGNGQSTGKLLTFYNLEKQEMEANIDIPYPVYTDGYDYDIVKHRSFEHRMAADEDHIYVAYCYTDLIDIYDKDGSLVKRLFGPDHFKPDYSLFGSETQGFMARPGEKAKFSYYSPVMTVDGLMVLYDGALQKERNWLLNQLFLFSPSGVPLVEFNLDSPIIKFCVDDSAKRIYGLTDTPDYQVICFDYGASL